MDDPEPQAAGILDQLLDQFDLVEPIVPILLVSSIVVSAVVWTLRSYGREDDQSQSALTGVDYVVALVALVVALLVSKHITHLMGASERLFDLSLIFTFTLLVMSTTILADFSLRSGMVLSLVVILVSILRFANESSEWFVGVRAWFVEYFPYEVEPKKLATGVLVFLLVSSTSYYFVRSFNERQKARVLDNRSVGIDPAAIQKLSFVFALIAGLLLSMIATGVSVPTITVVTGVLAAGIGFAAKDILSNIAAGVVLIWDGTFKVDDVISIDGGGYGWIDSFTLRHAVIKDRNDMSILIPYTKLIGSTIQNWTHNKNTVRLKIDIGVDYETADLNRAKEALLNAARTSDERVLDEPAPRVTVIAAGESAIHLQLRFWISDPKEGIRNVMSNVLEGMISELNKAEIRIPFNTMDVNLVSHVDFASKTREEE